MTVTATLVNATEYRLIYTINHDGGGGDLLTLTNAVMLADAATSAILQAMLNTPVGGAAAAGLLMLGAAPGVVHIVGNDIGIAPQAWNIQAQAGIGGIVQLAIRGVAGVAAAATLIIEHTHTYDR